MEFKYKMLINGKWLSSRNVIKIRNPYNNEVIGAMPLANPDQVNTAIQSAHDSREIMAAMPAHQRAKILEKTAALIEQRKEEFILAIIREAGKERKWTTIEVTRAGENCKFAAEEAKRIHGETVPMDASVGSENRFGVWVREPVGVVAAISPFNFPLNLVIHKVAPAIAAGNTVVLKPASNTPGASQLLGEVLLEAGLPPTALNIIYGPGRTTGELIVKDERVAKITFTGSPPVGRRIKALSGLKKVTLELGSNSGTIVDESADIDLAVSRCLMGSFSYSGQVCISVQRIYLHENIAKEFTAKFVKGTQNLVIGDPMEPDTDVGPMISESEAERAEAWIHEAITQGAKVLTGGKRNGSLLEPVVLSDVTHDMQVVYKEIFAPVVSLLTFKNFEQALQMLDNSIYGLQAGIFTQNISHAFRAIKQINVGGVIINDVPTYRADQMPYGGNKESGLGREGARFAIEEMTTLKMICFNL